MNEFQAVPENALSGIEFPAIVEDVDKAFQMLGGYNEVQRVLACSSRRLKLTFRPEMVFSKPACGDCTEVNGLLLRVRGYRNTRTGQVKIVPEVMGRVPRLYKFEAMADFQFGPFERKPPEPSQKSTRHRVFYEDIVVREVTKSLDHFFQRDVPLYLPPLVLSRQDIPFLYNYHPRHRTSEYIQMEERNQKTPCSRKSRRTFCLPVGMEDPTPQAPHPMTVEAVTSRAMFTAKLCPLFEKLFEERPIWLRCALAHRMPAGVSQGTFTHVLNRYAYSMVRGPWGRTSIRYGYDPRKEPDSRFYQTINFRTNHHDLIEQIVHQSSKVGGSISTETSQRHKSQRGGISAMWFDPALDSASSLQPRDAADSGDSTEDDEPDEAGDEYSGKSINLEVQESDFRFGPNLIPSVGFTVYCMKDIDIPEVQELISQPPARLECDPLDGWLEAGAQMTVRQHMYRYLQSWLAAKRKPRADAKATVKEEEGEGMDDAPNRPLDSSICTNLADK